MFLFVMHWDTGLSVFDRGIGCGSLRRAGQRDQAGSG